MHREANPWKRYARIGFVILVAAHCNCVHYRPLSAFLVRIQTDAARTVDELHLESMIRPIHQVYVAFLIIEWIIGDIQLATGDKFPARDPIYDAV